MPEDNMNNEVEPITLSNEFNIDGSELNRMRRTNMGEGFKGKQIDYLGAKSDIADRPSSTSTFRKGLDLVMTALHKQGKTNGDVQAQIDERVAVYHGSPPDQQARMSQRLNRDVERASSPLTAQNIPVPVARTRNK